jgi:hypothetical protein
MLDVVGSIVRSVNDVELEGPHSLDQSQSRPSVS